MMNLLVIVVHIWQVFDSDTIKKSNKNLFDFLFFAQGFIKTNIFIRKN